MNRNIHERRLGALKNERSSWEPHWIDIQKHLLPRRGRFLNAGNQQNNGKKLNNDILDSTGTFALNTLASGLMSGITSPARPWFRLVTSDPELLEFGPVKEWLFTVESRLRRAFQASNIYNCLQSTYEEIGAFGTAAMLLDENYDTLIRGYPFTVGEYYLANGPDLKVQTLYREYKLTVEQMVGQFGYEACSETVRNMYDRADYDSWIDVCHAIEPNPHHEPQVAGFVGKQAAEYKAAAKKPFRSCHWEKGASRDQYLKIGGYNDFPVMAPRWHVTGTDVYGRSPGMDALGDIKQLQHMERTSAQAVALMVKPPMTGPSSLKSPSILPGAMTAVDAMGQGQGFRPAFEVNPRLAEFNIKTEEARQRINRAFYADLFLMFAGDMRADRATATEITERSQEKLLALGPVLERLQNELLEPLIDRTFNIMVRHSMAAWEGRSDRGILPPPPKEIAGDELKVDYISMMAQAQRAVATTGIERFASFVGNLSAVHPESLDKIDFDQAVDEYGEALGISPRIVRSDDKVDELRKGRQEAVAAQQQQANAANMVNAAKLLSETDTGSDNALTRMMGGMGGAA